MRDQSDVPHVVLAEAFEYLEAGGDTGLTVRLNEQAWQRWSLHPRMLRDVSQVRTSIELFGMTLAAPLVLAPWSGQYLFHPDAERGTAQAARATGVGYCLSSGSSRSVEEIGELSAGFLFQLYLPTDRPSILPLVERVRAAGCRALMVTADQPPQANFSGFRGRVRRLPGMVSPNFADGKPIPNTPADLGPHDISWLAEQSGLPVLVKGLLRADDARTAVDAGAAGVVVSNHGGRQLDGAITTAEALPRIADEIAGEATILVDGGVRSATDIVRALALGADAVQIGRPVARALAAGGGAQVEQMLRTWLTETEAQFANCGVRAPDDVGPDLVSWRTWD